MGRWIRWILFFAVISFLWGSISGSSDPGQTIPAFRQFEDLAADYGGKAMEFLRGTAQDFAEGIRNDGILETVMDMGAKWVKAAADAWTVFAEKLIQ